MCLLRRYLLVPKRHFKEKLLKAQGWVTKKTDREKGEIQFPLDTSVNMSSSPSLRLHLSQMEKLLPFLPFLFGLVFCLFWMLNSLSDPGNKLSKHPKQQPIPLLQEGVSCLLENPGRRAFFLLLTNC